MTKSISSSRVIYSLRDTPGRSGSSRTRTCPSRTSRAWDSAASRRARVSRRAWSWWICRESKSSSRSSRARVLSTLWPSRYSLI